MIITAITMVICQGTNVTDNANDRIVTMVTWQHVGKGGIWSHLAPPQSGPHLGFNIISALTKRENSSQRA